MRRAAARKVWGLPVWWEAGDDAPPTLTAAAKTVPQVTVFIGGRHLHLTHGGDAAGPGLALPPGSAVTTTEEE